jgi:hypothetical protein
VAEATTIVSAGGFYRNRDTFVAVSRAVDSADPQPQTTAFPQKG